MSKIDIDWGDVKDDLLGILKDEVGDLLSDAKGDVENFLADIAKEMTTAMARGDKAQVEREHLMAQMKLIAAINRVRLIDAQWDTLGRVVNVAKRVGLGLLGGVGGLI